MTVPCSLLATKQSIKMARLGLARAWGRQTCRSRPRIGSCCFGQLLSTRSGCHNNEKAHTLLPGKKNWRTEGDKHKTMQRGLWTKCAKLCKASKHCIRCWANLKILKGLIPAAALEGASANAALQGALPTNISEINRVSRFTIFATQVLDLLFLDCSSFIPCFDGGSDSFE